MKKNLHPPYHPQATVVCACGNSFTVGSTKPLLKVEICSRCHPYFTGEQRIVDTAGQVERFMRRLEARSRATTAPAEEAQEGMAQASAKEGDEAG